MKVLFLEHPLHKSHLYRNAFFMKVLFPGYLLRKVFVSPSETTTSWKFSSRNIHYMKAIFTEISFFMKALFPGHFLREQSFFSEKVFSLENYLSGNILFKKRYFSNEYYFNSSFVLFRNITWLKDPFAKKHPVIKFFPLLA